MAGPARKREAVGHLQRDLELSQRHAPQPDAEEKRLRQRLNEFSRQRPRARYRTACGQLRREGLEGEPQAGATALAGGRAESAAPTGRKAAFGGRARTGANVAWRRSPTKCGAMIL
jgi:hypothetical protein